MVHILGNDPLGTSADVAALEIDVKSNTQAITNLQSTAPDQSLNTTSSPTFSTVNVTNSVLPDVDNLKDLGQPAKRFKSAYVTDVVTSTLNGNAPFTSDQTLNTTSSPTFNNVTLTTLNGNTPYMANQLVNTYSSPTFNNLTVTTAINGPVSISGGDLNMSIRKVTNLAAPTSTADATTKTYVDTADNLKLNLTGGTLTGQILTRDVFPSTTNLYALGTSSFKYADVQSTSATIDTVNMTNASIATAPTLGKDVANKTYVDAQRDTRLALAGGTMTGAINFLRTGDSSVILGSASSSSGTDNVAIGSNAAAGNGSFNVCIGKNALCGTNTVACVAIGVSARTLGTCFLSTCVGSDAGTGINNHNSVTAIGGQTAVSGCTSGSTYLGSRAGQDAGGFSKVVIINGTESQLNPTANNQIRIAAGGSTAIDAVPSELKFASGCVTAKASYMESWWAHNLLQTTAMVTNVASTSIRQNTETSFYFSPSLATAGRFSMIPVVLTSTVTPPAVVTPVFARDGPNSITEWVQTLVPIAANPAGPTTTGGNRVQYTYSGPAARRFSVTITGTYQTQSGATFIVFQGLIRFVSGVPNIINGTASSWFESDANRVFIGVSKKILLVNPGDVFEVAVGYDPLNAPNQLNNIIARDMTITFVSMLNNV